MSAITAAASKRPVEDRTNGSVLKDGTTRSSAKPADVAQTERGEIDLPFTLQQALVAGQYPALPTDVLALQRLAGNHAVAALADQHQGRNVQRTGGTALAPAPLLQVPTQAPSSAPTTHLAAPSSAPTTHQAAPVSAPSTAPHQSDEEAAEHRENMDLGNEGLEAGLVKPMSSGFEISEKADKVTLDQHKGEADWSGKEGTESHQHHMAESASAGADAEFIMSTVGLGIAGKNLNQKVEEREKARGQVHESVADRQVSIAGGNVASSAGSVLASGAEVAKGGVEIATALGTAGEAAATTAGTVAHSVALPFTLFNFFRTARKARLQDQRADRLTSLSLGSLKKPGEIEAAQKTHADELGKAFEDAKGEVSRSEEFIKALELKKDGFSRKHKLSQQRADQFDAQLRTLETKMKTANDPATFVMSIGLVRSWSDEAVQKRDAYAARVADTDKEISAEQAKMKNLVSERDNAEREAKEAQEAVNKKGKMKSELGKKSLTATGEQDTSLPSLEDIAAFALKKNKRGVVKKAVAATGLGLGAVGGILGIAALAGASLGLAGAIFGGAAAAVGLGVGIYKMYKKFSKRHKQAQAMEAARDSAQTNAGSDQKLEAGEGTWSRALAFWKPVTGGKRDRYATALVLYAVQGSEEEKKGAGEILGQLDPKRYDYSQGAGAEELASIKKHNASNPSEQKSEKDWKTAFADGSLNDDQREAITKHVKSKMAS